MFLLNKDRRSSPMLASMLCVAALLFVFAAAAAAQTPTPMPTPAVVVTDPPPVAPNFEAPLHPLPSADRVGVDNTNQLSLTLEQAIEMALKNNNDIAASRKDIRIAEFNLHGARGVRVHQDLITGEQALAHNAVRAERNATRWTSVAHAVDRHQRRAAQPDHGQRQHAAGVRH